MSELIHDGIARFVLGPEATCGMFPSNAKLVAGDPNKIKLRVWGKFSVSDHHVRIEVKGPAIYDIHQDNIRSIWDSEGKELFWRNPKYGEDIK